MPDNAMPLSRPIRPDVREALAVARGALARRYGARLLPVALYGSQARGEAHEGSDVDVLAVLAGPLQLYDEIKALTDLECELVDRFGVTVSLQPYEGAAFEAGATPFLQRVRRDAVEL